MKDKVIIITGVAMGLGLAAAKELASWHPWAVSAGCLTRFPMWQASMRFLA